MRESTVSTALTKEAGRYSSEFGKGGVSHARPITGDLAGVAYWDKMWSEAAKTRFDPDALANRDLADLIRRFLGPIPRGGMILEAGCGDSIVTAFVGEQGYQTAGIDYSHAGCEKFRRNAPFAAAHHADVFDPPLTLLGAADGVFSLGMVEHFDHTEDIIMALARLVKPGGYVLTVVPNMHGTVGLLQRLLNRAVYDIHVTLTPHDLRAAHRKLEVVDAGYLGIVSYGVVNPGPSFIARAIIGALARLSLPVMATGLRATSRFFSPYCYCLARVQEKA